MNGAFMQNGLSLTAVVPNHVEPIHPTWAVFGPDSSTAVLSTLQDMVASAEKRVISCHL